MKPLFTVHAGEYLVGSQIEKMRKDWNVWVPAKDTGIDLLVTNTSNNKAVSLQVKYSKDWTPNDGPSLVDSQLIASGWCCLQEKKIRESKADFWVFVLPSFVKKDINYVIISPTELLRRFRGIFGKAEKRFDSYLRVTKSGRCWEMRGLKIADQAMIACGQFKNSNRDFTPFLNSNGWIGLVKRLK